MSLSIFLVVCFGSTGTLLQSLGQSSKVLISDLVGSIVTVGSVVILISEYGIYGAALGMGIGFVAREIVALSFIYRIINAHPFSRLFVWLTIINLFLIYYLREILVFLSENYLLMQFKDEYNNYKNSVKRWLFF